LQGAGERRQAPVRAYANDQDRAQLGKRSAAPRCYPILGRRFWSRQRAGQVLGRESELTWSGEPRKGKSTMTFPAVSDSRRRGKRARRLDEKRAQTVTRVHTRSHR
jgi:hypothetical protein